MTGVFMRAGWATRPTTASSRPGLTDNPGPGGWPTTCARAVRRRRRRLRMGLPNWSRLMSFGILYVVAPGDDQLVLGGTELDDSRLYGSGSPPASAGDRAVPIAHSRGAVPLIGLSFQQEQYEANFRFMLVRLRENSEPVALWSAASLPVAGRAACPLRTDPSELELARWRLHAAADLRELGYGQASARSSSCCWRPRSALLLRQAHAGRADGRSTVFARASRCRARCPGSRTATPTAGSAWKARRQPPDRLPATPSAWPSART